MPFLSCLLADNAGTHLSVKHPVSISPLSNIEFNGIFTTTPYNCLLYFRQDLFYATFQILKINKTMRVTLLAIRRLLKNIFRSL